MLGLYFYVGSCVISRIPVDFAHLSYDLTCVCMTWKANVVLLLPFLPCGWMDAGRHCSVCDVLGSRKCVLWCMLMFGKIGPDLWGFWL